MKRPTLRLVCALVTGCALSAHAGCARLLGLDDDYTRAPDGVPEPEPEAGPPALDAGEPDTSMPPMPEADAGDPGIPLPTGKLVYHRYSSYYAGDSEMFLVDLPAGTRSPDLGQAYGVCHPMNGIFSPDGKKLAITGAPRPVEGCGATVRSTLEVYVLDLEAWGEKVRLTDNDVPDEDPQFSAQGDLMLFKHDGHIVEWPVPSDATFTSCDALPAEAYCFYSTELEQSKPVITPDGKTICYYEDHDVDADIYCFDRVLGRTGADVLEIRKPAVVHFDVFDARPTIDEKHLYYVRARSVDNPVTYIARNSLSDLNGVGEDGRFCTDQAANYIDPFSLGNDVLIYSSDEAGEGLHDLFIARFREETVIPLDHYIPNVNSPKQDIGASVWLPD